MKIYATLFAMFVGAVAGQTSDSENSLASACDNMSEGDTCYITLPDDSSVTGKCTTPASVSACGPEFTEGDKCMMCVESNSDDAEADGGADSGSVSKENVATAACDGAAENDECNYKTLGGEAVSGVCTDEGPGACGPDSSGACYVCSADVAVGGDNEGGVQNTNECSGLSVGDVCELPNGNGEGVCSETAEDLETGDGNLSCSPEGQEGSVGAPSSAPEDDAASLVSNVLQDACSDKKADDECTYYNADSELENGFCVSVGDALQCDDESNKNNSVDSDTETSLTNACTGLSAGSSCTIESDILSLSGVCQDDDNGDLICAPQFSLRGR